MFTLQHFLHLVHRKQISGPPTVPQRKLSNLNMALINKAGVHAVAPFLHFQFQTPDPCGPTGTVLDYHNKFVQSLALVFGSRAPRHTMAAMFLSHPTPQQHSANNSTGKSHRGHPCDNRGFRVRCELNRKHQSARKCVISSRSS